MPFDRARARPLLQSCDLPKLFIEELGWEPLRQKLTLNADKTDYALAAVAQKKGFAVWQCTAPGGGIPEHAIRLKLDRQLSETSYEHIIIFTTADHTRQSWVWVRKQTGKPIAVRTHEYHRGQPGESLVQKLEALYVSIEEEEAGDLSTIAVAGRARAAFDVEKVTKKFYKDFDSHRKTFLGFIQGIPDSADRDWYASVMLNRLMFVYFIQRKGFLSGDRDYLRNRLALCQKEQGKNKFYNFYRYFLLRLFHEGFGKRRKDRAPDFEKLLGTIPYLNGGLFDVHELEREERYGPTIQIKDEAFQKIFDYFDRYQWHLDERPLRADNEINPDVLGYIFEQYINNKQMGAYYTKEDITEYIGKSCIIPFLIDSTRAKCRVSFEGTDGGSTVWSLLAENPDRYIYPAVKHGTAQKLPAEIEVGVADVSRREGWNRPAPAEFALPTETWREVVARRQRYTEVRAKLAAGEVREINDFITYNLDLRQFAQDLVQNAEGPELLTAFWQAISTITVLDPTGGSGAFIFAALNILEPLYEGCLDRMEDFIKGWGEAGQKLHPNYHKKFSAVLANVAKHPNRRYFILKSIILNNLYAVDIMEEAVEICKLRLFLKLASQVEPDTSKDNLGIEPLPDIDFNIRAGNTLVGYATYDEVKQAVTSGLDFDNAMGKIETKAADLQQTFDKFRQLQTEGDGSVPYEHKVELQKRLTALENELDRHLAGEYGVNFKDSIKYESWRLSHLPFHWFIQFHGILANGGFDVIIGNPPYIASTKIRKQYGVRNLSSSDAPDIYAPCMERAINLLGGKSRFGMIVPISFQFGADFRVIREYCRGNLEQTWAAAYSRNPSALFSAGLGVRNTIVCGIKKNQAKTEYKIFTTKLHRWTDNFRPFLFQDKNYYQLPKSLEKYGWPRIASRGFATLFDSLAKRGWALSDDVSRGGPAIRFKTTALYYISAFIKDPPCYEENGEPSEQTKVGALAFRKKDIRDTALVISLGKIALTWWAATGDDFDVTGSGLGSTPIRPSSLAHALQSKLSGSVPAITAEMDKNVIYTRYAGKMMGNYDIKRVRHILDNLDNDILRSLDLDNHIEDIELAYDMFMKATGERPGTTRENPFDEDS